MSSIVIVGSGLAGYSVAREVRKRSKTDQLVLVTADDGHFYSKPVLSEAHRLGATASELILRTADKMAGQIKGEVLTETRVGHIDTATRSITTSAGVLSYDKLVLATGAAPARLPLDADSLAHVLTVNDLMDYGRFRQATYGKKTIAIIGAGLIGCEFANDLAAAGYKVHVVDIAELPLARLLPDPNGRYMYDALQRIGVEWHLGTHVQSIAPQGKGVVLYCADGTVIPADVVLSATGLRPRTELARAAGLKVSHGIVVNSALRTSDPHIYALGDCAEIGGVWLPYIAPIVPAAKVIAAAIAGQDSAICYGCMPVSVKTPACPTIVSPPPQGLAGGWDTEVANEGLQSLFHDAGGHLRGFALSGEYTSRVAALTELMPSPLQ